MSAFQIIVSVDDRGLSVNSPAPPSVVARCLREALASVEADLLAARVTHLLESQRRVEIVPASAIVDKNGRAPI